MEFSPFNKIVKLCLQGMALEEQNKPDEAIEVYQQSWNESRADFEQFLSAYYLARAQKGISDRLKWWQTTLELALKINDNTVKSALSSIYTNLAECYEDLNEIDKATAFYELAKNDFSGPADKGPFYHGTKADLMMGDLLVAGGHSNYQSDLKMNHIYFTGLLNGAGLAAELAKGDSRPRVYVVEPIGTFENDPNLTNKKFPGNPTRSYRSESPLKIIGEVTDWQRPSPDGIQKFKEKLDNNKGEIIN